MKRIYIAGKISGECDTPEDLKKCWNKFEKYGINLLKEVNPISYSIKENFYITPCETVGFTHGFIINSELIVSKSGTWEKYMKNDLTHLLMCDEIHMLPDWYTSKGACIERQLAEDLGIKIVEVKDFSYLA